MTQAAVMMLPCWVNATSNRVPNLRLMAAEIGGVLAPLLSEDDKNSVMKALDVLIDDKDPDVSYYAKHASVATVQGGNNESEKTDSKTEA